MLTATTTASESTNYEEQRLASLELAAPRLAGYEVLQFLGSGTYGDVWKARAIASGITVAIKRLRREPDAQAREEVQKLAKLSTARGIVALREVHLSEEPYCYVMEYLDGGTLAELIRDKGPLPMKRAWRIFRELIEALSYVHKEGIVHCDIKPENILLDIDGHPRLCDFGQARARGPQETSLGTRFYMSPEQARMESIPDPRWDIYALGAILYEMLTGQKPRFDPALSQLLSTPSGSGSEVRDRLEKYARHLESHPRPKAHRQVKGVDASVASLVDVCLTLDFEARPQDASAVRARIAECDHSRQMRPLLIFGEVAPAVMLLVFGVAILAIGALTFRSESERWEKVSNAYNPSASRDIARDLKQLFDEASSIVELEAKDDSVRSAIQDGKPEACREVLEGLYAKHVRSEGPKTSFDRWSLADADGNLLANYGKLAGADGVETVDSDEGSNEKKQFAWRGWFNGVQDFKDADELRPDHLKRFQQRSPRPFISQPFIRKGDKPFVVVAISCPIFSGDKKVGVLAAQLTWDHFFETLRTVAKKHDEGGQQIVLINEESQVVFHSDEENWNNAGGQSNFQVPHYPDCEAYSKKKIAEYANLKEHSISYQDPVCRHYCWASPTLLTLSSGQRFVVFAQQNDAMDYLKWKLIGVAVVLLLLGGVFLGVNSYALYWMQRQQRENVVDV